MPPGNSLASNFLGAIQSGFPHRHPNHSKSPSFLSCSQCLPRATPSGRLGVHTGLSAAQTPPHPLSPSPAADRAGPDTQVRENVPPPTAGPPDGACHPVRPAGLQPSPCALAALSHSSKGLLCIIMAALGSSLTTEWKLPHQPQPHRAGSGFSDKMDGEAITVLCRHSVPGGSGGAGPAQDPKVPALTRRQGEVWLCPRSDSDAVKGHWVWHPPGALGSGNRPQEARRKRQQFRPQRGAEPTARAHGFPQQPPTM